MIAFVHFDESRLVMNKNGTILSVMNICLVRGAKSRASTGIMEWRGCQVSDRSTVRSPTDNSGENGPAADTAASS